MDFSLINNFINDLPSLTLGIVGAILLLTVYFLFFNFNSVTVSNAPTLLTSIGIFGTFLGIALGLMGFDPTDIRGSVPQLIDGLKTAFWSSIAGLFGALLIKGRHIYNVSKRRVVETEYHGATVDDLANLLNEVNRSLVGEEESTLLSQVKLARQDSNDRLDMLNRSMGEYLKEMAKSNSEALIEALKEVINDFNAKINEQFGDNFKQLNEAVGKILEWQELYRTQMQEMIEQQKTSSENMATATMRYETVVGHAESFATLTNSLSVLLQGLETQRTHIHSTLEQFSTLVDKARTGLPEIETKIMELTNQTTRAVTANSDAITRANEELNQHVKQLSEKTKDQVAELDKALSEELTKSLETLGKQLTALSEKFVSDYTPLTDKLRSVLSIARDA